MMRNLLIAITILCCFALTAVAQSQPAEHADEHSHEHAKTSEQATNVMLAPGEVVRRGEPSVTRPPSSSRTC
jgi:uncharacterized protein involved in copper resistance